MLKIHAEKLVREHACSPVINLASDRPICEIDGYILSNEQKNDTTG
jgi:hypothetical protein